MTALITACYNSNAAVVVDVLLKAGADVNMDNHDGMTALMGACYNSSLDTTVVVDLLLKAGANVNMVDKRGMTALMLACLISSPAVVDLLTNAEAKYTEGKYQGI